MAASIQVRTVDGPYAELLRGLRHGDLDVLIGALRDPLPSDDVIQEPLLDDTLAIVVGPHHPLAHKSNLSVADTMAYPWIAPPKATPTGTYLYHMLDIAECRRHTECVLSPALWCSYAAYCLRAIM